MGRGKTIAAAALVCACLAGVPVVWAAETLSVHARFSPDRLGASTNVSVTATFQAAGARVPSPLRAATAYLPAGLAIDVRGAGKCSASTLEEAGPGGCPADSRIGFGGGTGVIELAREVIREPFTVDLFLGPSERGHLVVLAYVNASSPVTFQLVMVAREVRAPKPYGIGFVLEVPPIPTLPEAANASIERAFLSVGEDDVAYFRRVHGRSVLVHVPGVIVPKRCPPGGFPFDARISFEDGSMLDSVSTIPCPRS